ncbi:RBBP9/YdeN family alpha/beta hydrolase [Streptomyces sp. NPDC051913]|uniref:RBBP9/YdeN family alpha/beta hydrolase n=1 Tax=Streptomyces sp. NPDC051913 TaxID=3365676 RepID=UPI0037D0E380
MTAYLILHGWQNHRPADHWQHHLADRLTDLGHQVTYPQLPDPDDPSLEVWLSELTRCLAQGPDVVVAHSASVLLWLHAVARGTAGVGDVERVLLVAPPARSVLEGLPEVAEFVAPPLDFTLPGPTFLVAGDDDPYCPGGARAAYGDPLGVPTRLLPGAAHLDLDAGYGAWPSVLEWCLDPEAEFKVR